MLLIAPWVGRSTQAPKSLINNPYALYWFIRRLL
jgi:hypothetical protein